VQKLSEVQEKMQVQINALRLENKKMRDRIEILETQMRTLVERLAEERSKAGRLSEVLLVNGIRED
jgi:cell division protein FtsB